MKTVTKKLHKLLEALKINEEVYMAAAARPENESIKAELIRAANRKKELAYRVAFQMYVDLENLEQTFSYDVNHTISRVLFESAYLLLKFNHSNMTKMLVKREKWLAHKYKELLLDPTEDSAMTALLRSELSAQLNETLTFIDELKMTQEVYVLM